MTLRIVRPLVLLGSGWCLADNTAAQDLAPRAYTITPVGANTINLGYSHLEGGLQFDGAVPITGADATARVAVVSY
jgi:hypothetical protein